MYVVVGCTDCSFLWVVETGGETTTCPRCSSRHRTEKLRHFAEAEDAEDAREARSAIVANRRGEGDAAPTYGDLEAAIDGDAVDDETRLEAAGIDPERVAEAGEQASEGHGSSRSRRETVLSAFEEHEQPTAEQVREHADERGVSREYVDRLLRKLERAGEIAETGDGYRKL